MKTQAHKPTNTIFLIFVLFVFSTIFLTAQNRQDYYVIAKPGYNLEPIHLTPNPDQTLTLDLENNSLETFFNSLPIYFFQKEFTSSNSSYLQRVYKVTLDNETHLQDFFNRGEVEYVELVSYPESLYLPNDYINLEGDPLSQLDLIKAPLAWNITTGDPTVLAGIVDDYFDIGHEDLINQIAIQLNDNGNGSHGTQVAGTLAAETDNDIGISSIGFNTKLALLSRPYNNNDLLNLSLFPGVRVINISAGQCDYSPIMEELYREIWEDNGVVVVCAAGNAVDSPGSCNGDPEQYVYPASYDHTISVTSVGHLFPFGTNDPILGMSNWKDVHESIIGDPNSTNQHNDKVDLCAPGYRITTTANDDNYVVSGGTSLAAPIVAGVVALMYSVNPNLTPDEVLYILKSTADDIYHIPTNFPYIGKLGTGRVNAYRAVLTAKCMLNPIPGLDLAMQNSDLDTFVEPDTQTEIVWQSEDIWVRNQDDGDLIDVHQNPEYDANNPNYVYVRVTNNSCETSSGNDNLILYWAKASTSLYWPEHWNGDLSIEDPETHEYVLMGDEVGTLSIPVLGPGESKVIEYEWDVPNPEDYININPSPWHFCLLARIVSLADPMTFPEGLIITNNVKNNNNIVWKNTTVVDIFPGTVSQIGGVVAVGNPFETAHSFSLEFKMDGSETGKPIYEEAEVSIEMDDVLYDAWVRGGNSATEVDSTHNPKKKIILNNNATLSNIQFNPKEIGTLNVSFNFLTAELTDKNDFTFYVIQRDAVNNEVMGGETYLVNKKPRPIFSANAGNDETIDRSESVTISAAQINEAAIYNWYAPGGELIYTGPNLTVTPDITQRYRLEIITDTDGYKDYDEVEVTVNPYKLESLVPNPASSQVTVNYIADEAGSAYLMVVSTVTGISNNYILDVNETSINLNISGYSSGLYSVALVCDGEIVGSKNLAKQ